MCVSLAAHLPAPPGELERASAFACVCELCGCNVASPRVPDRCTPLQPPLLTASPIASPIASPFASPLHPTESRPDAPSLSTPHLQPTAEQLSEQQLPNFFWPLLPSQCPTSFLLNPKLQPTAEELSEQQLQLHLPATRGSRQPRVFTLG